MKSYLSGRGVDYIEKDVTLSEAAVFELVRTYGSRSTPTTVVGDEVIIGFDPERLDAALAE